MPGFVSHLSAGVVVGSGTSWGRSVPRRPCRDRRATAGHPVPGSRRPGQLHGSCANWTDSADAAAAVRSSSRIPPTCVAAPLRPGRVSDRARGGRPPRQLGSGQRFATPTERPPASATTTALTNTVDFHLRQPPASRRMRRHPAQPALVAASHVISTLRTVPGRCLVPASRHRVWLAVTRFGLGRSPGLPMDTRLRDQHWSSGARVPPATVSSAATSFCPVPPGMPRPPSPDLRAGLVKGA